MIDSIFIVGLFLYPKNRNVCVSKRFTLLDIFKYILEICLKWDISELEAKSIMDMELQAYYRNETPYDIDESDVIKYWQSVLGCDSNSLALPKLALIIYSLVPSSAAVERLFSRLGCAKSKSRNRMGKDTPTNLGKIKDYTATTSAANNYELSIVEPTYEAPIDIEGVSDTESESSDDEGYENYDRDTLFLKGTFEYINPLPIPKSALQPVKKQKWTVENLLADARDYN